MFNSTDMNTSVYWLPHLWFAEDFQGLVIPEEYRDVVLSIRSSAEFFLPSFTGAGRCILLLTAYLINLNNTLLENFARIRKLKWAVY